MLQAVAVVVVAAADIAVDGIVAVVVAEAPVQLVAVVERIAAAEVVEAFAVVEDYTAVAVAFAAVAFAARQAVVDTVGGELVVALDCMDAVAEAVLPIRELQDCCCST